MEVAHQRGIVHRDLKPANILLANVSSQSSMIRQRDADTASLPEDHWSRTMVPKIADFGLAKRTDDDSSQTQSGAILGTPSYMAPEQAGGKTREIGPAVDIYALGAILYEMLVGRPPFKAGNPIDTVRQVIEQDPVPPRQLEPRVPYDLETICLKCLEKDPARRFATAAELADDLRRFIEGDPIRARPTPAWESAWKWGRPATVALLGLIPMAITSIVLFVLWHNLSLRGQLARALAEERNARQREQDVRQENQLSLVRHEGQRLIDGARVAVAARDWATARLELEKALTTIGNMPRLETVKEPAQALLKEVEHELNVEADRRASRARLEQFIALRDGALFLGTLYTGMDLAANLEAARATVGNALDVYGVPRAGPGEPRFDAYLSEAQKSEVRGDCAQLLLILAGLTGDGRLDVVTTDYGSNSISILLNRGAGLFAPPELLATDQKPLATLVGDFNGDGLPDLATINNHDSTISVVLGKGNGTNVADGRIGASRRLPAQICSTRIELWHAQIASAIFNAATCNNFFQSIVLYNLTKEPRRAAFSHRH